MQQENLKERKYVYQENRRCNKCGKFGHIYNECRYNRRITTCRICNKKGHETEECWNKEPKREQRNTGTTTTTRTREKEPYDRIKTQVDNKNEDTSKNCRTLAQMMIKIIQEMNLKDRGK